MCELPGILNRALRGLKRFSAQKGFTVPQAVKDALSSYERQNDSLATFLEEAVDRGPTFSVPKQRFYQRYCRWCDLYRLRPVSQKELKPRLYKLVPDLDEARFDSKRASEAGKAHGAGSASILSMRILTRKRPRTLQGCGTQGTCKGDASVNPCESRNIARGCKGRLPYMENRMIY